VRPEAIRIVPDENGSARVTATSFLGSHGRAQVRLADGTVVVAQLPSADAASLRIEQPVEVSVRPVPVLATSP
jgi:putative spermidine/putrescine transport system ATP-binding protein